LYTICTNKKTTSLLKKEEGSMKITGLEAHGYSAPYSTPIANGKYCYASTDIVVVSVKTDDGIAGHGWTHGTQVVIDTLNSLKERIIGEDPFNVERIWDKMYLPKIYGRKGSETRAISAVDIALWDIKGKVAGRSLHQMLGGFKDTAYAYIAGGYYEADKGFAGLQEEMKANVAKGARAVKMKIGGTSIGEDTERIDAVREAVGAGISILVDANNAYNRLDALKMGRELDRRNIYWFEEPLSPDDLEGCAELRRKIDTPIAVGENEYTRWGFKQLLDAEAAQVFNADAQVLGGVTEWKKVADLAMASHILIAPHGDQEIHAHLVSAVPNGLIVEYYDNNLNALKELMFKTSLTLDAGGTVSVPSSPGIGFEINFEALERFRTYPAN
jgi:D-arabinonate dehydratase